MVPLPVYERALGLALFACVSAVVAAVLLWRRRMTTEKPG
jgi:hypothetical protein